MDFSTGTNPYNVAIGDLDGDGKPDLAVTNYGSNTVSVFRNTSTSGTINASSFASKVDFSTGVVPFGVAIGDLDGDSKPDLAVTNRNGSTVSLFRNTSTSGTIDASSFAAKVDFSTGTIPLVVAIGDLDGDGKPDLAVVNYGSNSVSLFLNTSTSGTIDASSFAAKVDFSTGTNPWGVAIGDLDGDGKPDLAVTNFGGNTVSVFRNTSTSGTIDASSFAAKVDFSTGTNPVIIAIGDLDGDGKPDLAVTNYSSNAISVFLNTNTSGTIDASSFAARMAFSTGSNPYSVAIGDLDGDGKPDLAVTNSGSNTVSVFRNTSTSGTIDASSFAAKVDFSTGSFPLGVAIGDLDGDGKLDLAVANYTGNTVSVFRNTSTSGTINASSFASKVDFSTGTNPWGVAIGDLDGDSKPDLAVTNYGSNTVSVFRNTSTSGTINASSFAARVNFSTGINPYNVAIGDLDGDGKPDLAVTNYGSNTVSVFRNTSTSGTIDASSFAAKVDFSTGNSPYSIAIGDLDGDGKPDLALTNSGSNTVSVLRNTSTSGTIDASSFASKVDFSTGVGPFGVAIGDLNGDGKPDLAVANFTGNTISVFRNTSTSGTIDASSFASKVDFSAGTSPVIIAIGDLDGDGKPDLAVTNYFGNTVSVLRNTSDTTAPDTSIDSNPSDPSNSSAAVFTFSGDDGSGTGIASFECQVNSGGYSACTSGTDFGPLSNGTHSFDVRAIDNAGNTDATPASYTWTVVTTVPSVVSVVRADANPTNASSVNFTVTFSEFVTGVDPSDFSLTTTGSVSGATVSGVSGSGTIYTVTVDTGIGDGTIRLDVLDNDSIIDADSNPLDGGFTSGEVYTIDKTAPSVTSVNRADPSPSSAASVNFTVTFSESVTGVDAIPISTLADHNRRFRRDRERVQRFRRCLYCNGGHRHRQWHHPPGCSG